MKPSKNTGTIVLIDDNKAEVMLCKQAFMDIDLVHPLETFLDGQSAFEYISANAAGIFMIVCDISMPRMSGLELLAKINADPHLKFLSIPFIFLTNSSQPKDVSHAYSLSAQGYFQKPMGLDELSDIFKSMLGYWNRSLIPRDDHDVMAG